ncbi:MAG: hypothetical protein WB762_29815 [Candidatus Sulfotelmatobacter sp.]
MRLAPVRSQPRPTHRVALCNPGPAVTVGAFWQTTYLPWVKANKRSSNIRGYKSDWKLYVKPELETTPVDACRLLDYMMKVKKLNENTPAHVKSLCSGIFAAAIREGIIKFRWREASESVKVRKGETAHRLHTGGNGCDIKRAHKAGHEIILCVGRCGGDAA